MNWLAVTAGVLSTAALLSLLAALWAFWRRPRLYWLSGRYSPPDLPTAWKIIFTVAWFSWIFVIGYGVHGLLWWMPSSWGWVSSGDEGPQWQTLRSWIATLIAIVLATLSSSIVAAAGSERSEALGHEPPKSLF